MADERVLAPGAGPLAPGDLAWVSKTPNGFFPERGHHLPPLGGAQAISSVLGLQGLNDHLEGKGTAGLQVGWNVLDLGVDGTPSAVLPDAQDGRFKLGLLDSFRLDGVIISNEAANSTHQSNDCVLNICIQGACTRTHTQAASCHRRLHTLDEADAWRAGPTPLNNGFRAYDAHALPPSAQAYKRDLTHDYIGRIHEAAIDALPKQMFDRKVMHRDSLYVGLRAVYLSTKEKLRVRDANGNLLFLDAATAEPRCLVRFAYAPFSARACHELVAAAAERAAAERAGKPAKPAKPPPPFAAIDDADYAHFVGAWLVGTVMDTAAATREVRRDSPRNAAFSVTVNAQIEWRNALPVSDAAFAPDGGKGTIPSNRWEAGVAMRQSPAVLSNFVRPAMRTLVGEGFGAAVFGAASFCAVGRARMAELVRAEAAMQSKRVGEAVARRQALRAREEVAQAMETRLAQLRTDVLAKREAAAQAGVEAQAKARADAAEAAAAAQAAETARREAESAQRAQASLNQQVESERRALRQAREAEAQEARAASERLREMGATDGTAPEAWRSLKRASNAAQADAESQAVLAAAGAAGAAGEAAAKAEQERVRSVDALSRTAGGDPPTDVVPDVVPNTAPPVDEQRRDAERKQAEAEATEREKAAVEAGPLPLPKSKDVADALMETVFNLQDCILADSPVQYIRYLIDRDDPDVADKDKRQPYPPYIPSVDGEFAPVERALAVLEQARQVRPDVRERQVRTCEAYVDYMRALIVNDADTWDKVREYRAIANQELAPPTDRVILTMLERWDAAQGPGVLIEAAVAKLEEAVVKVKAAYEQATTDADKVVRGNVLSQIELWADAMSELLDRCGRTCRKEGPLPGTTVKTNAMIVAHVHRLDMVRIACRGHRCATMTGLAARATPTVAAPKATKAAPTKPTRGKTPQRKRPVPGMATSSGAATMGPSLLTRAAPPPSLPSSSHRGAGGAGGTTGASTTSQIFNAVLANRPAPAPASAPAPAPDTSES